ncbi:MAG TPA: hypothetical protein VJH91_03445 [Candidatus Paceibacterota bacterium]
MHQYKWLSALTPLGIAFVAVFVHGLFQSAQFASPEVLIFDAAIVMLVVIIVGVINAAMDPSDIERDGFAIVTGANGVTTVLVALSIALYDVATSFYGWLAMVVLAFFLVLTFYAAVERHRLKKNAVRRPWFWQGLLLPVALIGGYTLEREFTSAAFAIAWIIVILTAQFYWRLGSWDAIRRPDEPLSILRSS